MGAPALATRALDSGVEWATPDDFVQGVAARFGPFDLDAAATAENAKAPSFYTKEDDGLKQPWTGRVWCNPPYGRGHNEAWARKAAEAVHTDGADLVAYLVPVSTETAWWGRYIFSAAEIHFIERRLKFGGAVGGGTFASALCIFRRGHAGPPSFFRMDTEGNALSWPEPWATVEGVEFSQTMLLASVRQPERGAE